MIPTHKKQIKSLDIEKIFGSIVTGDLQRKVDVQQLAET